MRFLAVAYDVVSSCHPPLRQVLLSSMHATHEIMGRVWFVLPTADNGEKALHYYKKGSQR
jgi:hypothetical protein